MSTTVTTDTAVEADVPVLLAVSYLRVSTREQAERGGTEEGFSIPAQREANARKAAELEAGRTRVRGRGRVGQVGRPFRAARHACVHRGNKGGVLHRAQARPARPQPR